MRYNTCGRALCIFNIISQHVKNETGITSPDFVVFNRGTDYTCICNNLGKYAKTE